MLSLQLVELGELTTVLLLGLAVMALLRFWLEARPLASWRARLEAYRERWWAQLLLCPLCLTPYLTLLCWAIWQIELGRWLVKLLAICSVAGLSWELLRWLIRAESSQQE